MSSLAVEVAVRACPPSLNSVSGRGGHWNYTKARQRWHRLLGTELVAAGMVRCDSVYVEGCITFPDRRKRDQGNYRAPLEKFLGDTLQLAGYLDDDDWTHYQFGDLTARYERRCERTDLILYCSGVRAVS